MSHEHDIKLWINLFPNRWHTAGDKKPCITGHRNGIEIKESLEPGIYDAAMWRRDNGNYSMILQRRCEEKEQTDNHHEGQAEEPKEQKPKKKVKDNLNL